MDGLMGFSCYVNTVLFARFVNTSYLVVSASAHSQSINFSPNFFIFFHQPKKHHQYHLQLAETLIAN